MTLAGGVAPPVVVLCPPLAPDTAPPAWSADLAAALQRAGIPVLAPTAAAPQAATSAPPAPPGTDAPTAADERLAIAGWVADQAVAITASARGVPLILVAVGQATRGLPALGLSQRAARHNVIGYVLVDGGPPPANRSGVDWPDAPVLYVVSPDGPAAGLSAAHLRGWVTVQSDPVEAIVAHARVWPDPVP